MKKLRVYATMPTGLSRHRLELMKHYDKRFYHKPAMETFKQVLEKTAKEKGYC